MRRGRPAVGTGRGAFSAGGAYERERERAFDAGWRLSFGGGASFRVLGRRYFEGVPGSFSMREGVRGG